MAASFLTASMGYDMVVITTHLSEIVLDVPCDSRVTHILGYGKLLNEQLLALCARLSCLFISILQVDETV